MEELEPITVTVQYLEPGPKGEPGIAPEKVAEMQQAIADAEQDVLAINTDLGEKEGEITALQALTPMVDYAYKGIKQVQGGQASTVPISVQTLTSIQNMGGSSANNGTTFFNGNDPADTMRVISELSIKVVGSGQVMLVKANKNYSNRTDLFPVNVTAGYNEIETPPTTLLTGEIIGVRGVGVGICFNPSAGIGFWSSDSLKFNPGMEIGYSLTGYTKNFYDIYELSSKADAMAASIATNTGEIATAEGDIVKIKGSVVQTPKSCLTQTGLASLPNSAGLGRSYINRYTGSANIVFTVTKFKIRASGGVFTIIKSNESFQNIEDVLTLTAVAGIQEFTVNILLKPGEILGVKLTSTNISFNSSAGIGAYTSDGGFVNNFEMGYEYEGYGEDIKSLLSLTEDVEDILSSTNGQEKTVTLFSDDFSVQNPIWSATGWTFSSGKFTSVATGMANRLLLNKVYHADKRTMRAKVKMGSDTDLRIHIKWSTEPNSGEGASMFGVNVATKKITLYAVNGVENASVTSTGVTETPHTEVSIPFEIVAGREYYIDVEKDGYTNIVSFLDSVTGNTATAQHTGWETGRQNDRYGFFVASGSAVELLDFSVKSVKHPFAIAVGDSITEGVMVLDKSKRWAEQLRALLDGDLVISARGQDNIDGVIAKFDTEFKFMRPKYLILLIGANGGNTTSKIQTVLNLCAQYGITPIWNYCTCQTSDSHTAKNAMIAGFNLPGCRFDIATAKSNIPNADASNPSPRYNPALYWDTTHPTNAGNDEMVKRFKLDIDFLFK